MRCCHTVLLLPHRPIMIAVAAGAEASSTCQKRAEDLAFAIAFNNLSAQDAQTEYNNK